MLLMTSGVYSAFFGLFILTLLAVRDWLQGGKCQSKARMDGKVVVITGANAGIGYETAKDLSMRNPLKSFGVLWTFGIFWSA